MMKKLRYLCTLLLLAVTSGVWADDVAFYTLNTENQKQSSNTNYNNTYEISINDFTWFFTGNMSTDTWRVGGKSLSGVNRDVYTGTAMSETATKLVLTLSTGGSITLNSFTLTVASDADFTKVIDTVTKTSLKLSGDNEFTPSAGKEWTKGAYYKFTFNVSVSGTANKYIGFDKVVFYKAPAAGELIDPTVEIGSTSIEIDGTTEVTTNGPAVTLTTEDDEVTISGTTITGAKAGTATVTATWQANDKYKAGSKDFTVTVTDPYVKGGRLNPYTVAEAIEFIGTLGTATSDEVYVKGIISQVDKLNYDKIIYWISDDGTTTNQMEVYNGYGLDGAAFTDVTDLSVYDKVTVCGKVKKYNTISEFVEGSKIVSLEKDTTPRIFADDVTLDYDATSGEIAYELKGDPEAGVVTIGARKEADCEWITGLNFESNPITFTTTVNEGAEDRTTTITISWTGAEDKVVTVTQKAAPVIIDNIPDLFAAAEAAGDTGTDVLVKFGGWHVTGVSGSNVFVSDGTHGFIIYCKDHGFDKQEVLSSETPISCTLKLYRGSAELVNFKKDTEGLNIASGGGDPNTSIEIADLSGINTGAVVKYINLTCEADGSDYYLTDGTNYLKVYKTLYSEAFSKLEDGKKYDIIGVYQQYDETKEILPRWADDIIPSVGEITVEIGGTGYATLFYKNYALEIPEGVTASYVAGLNGKQLITETFDGLIPAETGVILEGEPGEYKFKVSNDASSGGIGLLYGTDEKTSTIDDPDYYYYKFVNETDGVGFWWGATDGGPFENEAHKAYLRIPKSEFEDISAPAKIFIFGGEGLISTGINKVDKIAEDAAIYNLNGVRVNKVQKGVYVVNGKKVVIK